MIAAITDQRIGLGGAIGAATAQRKPIQVPDIRKEPTSPVNEIIVPRAIVASWSFRCSAPTKSWAR